MPFREGFGFGFKLTRKTQNKQREGMVFFDIRSSRDIFFTCY